MILGKNNPIPAMYWIVTKMMIRDVWSRIRRIVGR